MTTDMPARMLRLLSLLQTRRTWPGGELAGRLGVTGRTMRRDIDRLRELGYPVEGTTGTAGGYRLVSGRDLPPLLLDDEEAVAIAVGLRTAADGGVSGIGESSVRALAKLGQVLPARLRDRIAAIGEASIPVARRAVAPVDPAALAVLATACRDHEQVSFDYRGRDGTPSERRVEPHSLIAGYGLWYLIAYDTGPQDWRTFRVDRLARPAPRHRRFTPRRLPAADAAAYLAGALAAAPYRYTAHATVQAPAATVRTRLPTLLPGRVEALDEHTCTVRFGSDSPGAIVRDLVGLEADFTLDGPAELLDQVRTAARRLSEAPPRRPPGGDRSEHHPST